MRTVTLAAAGAVVLAALLGSAPATAQSTAVEAAPAGQASKAFAAFAAVGAVPMTDVELDAVRGLHFHFTTPSGKELLVNIQKGKVPPTPTPNPDLAPDDSGPPIVGKGYRGLCGAALRAVGLSIPGQDTSTGMGGGC